MNAALRDDGEKLVTITNKLGNNSLMDTVVSPKNHVFLEGAVDVHVWNVRTQACVYKTNVTEKLTKFHNVGFLNDYPVVSFQEDFSKTSDNHGNNGVMRKTVEQTAYTVTRILHSDSGDVLGKITIEGDYDTLTVPSDATLDGVTTLDQAMQRIMLSATRKGVFTSTSLVKNSAVLRYVIKSSSVTAYGFASDNQSAVVGFDTGSVRFLRLSRAKGRTFLGKN